MSRVTLMLSRLILLVFVCHGYCELWPQSWWLKSTDYILSWPGSQRFKVSVTGLKSSQLWEITAPAAMVRHTPRTLPCLSVHAYGHISPVSSSVLPKSPPLLSDTSSASLLRTFVTRFNNHLNSARDSQHPYLWFHYLAKTFCWFLWVTFVD